jgi:addiction module HigA family antidote
MKTLPSIHPGEVLREDFLVPLGITPYRLAKDIGVQQTRMAEVLAGRRSITVDTAVRLARYLGTTPQLWLNLQNHHDLEVAQVEAHERYDQIIPFAQTSARAAPLAEEMPKR